MQPTRFRLEVIPRLPEKLAMLPELAANMLFSWNWRIRNVFVRMDRELWRACNHDPQVFLRRVSQVRLDKAATDRSYLMNYRQAITTYNAYMEPGLAPAAAAGMRADDLVAYFCMEYGLHESLRIYSGGLGILAGDHCKAASDLGLPFVGVGLLFHEGYFDQLIDAHGEQHDSYSVSEFGDLPVQPLRNAPGADVIVTAPLPGRDVQLRVWKLAVGRVTLLLLDSDLPQNDEADRGITYKLYGGDEEMRLRQELCLGIGGVRALRQAGYAPTAWHINEGHAAFLVLERCRELTAAGQPFDVALETVAASTLFTTHTPVAAGHDAFARDLAVRYLQPMAESLGLPVERIASLGDNGNGGSHLNMTALALRGSRYHNGVSRVHGETASRMEAYMWPQVPADENPLDYVTNGVHLETFLAAEWGVLFDQWYGDEWRARKNEPAFWEQLAAIPDQIFWGVHQALKSQALTEASRRAESRYTRLGYSEAETRSLLRFMAPQRTDVLTLGFARRFTAYKRAGLLFRDLERLQALLTDPERPVQVLFAGKAHPRDEQGRRILRDIHAWSQQSELRGRVVLLEGYDMGLARSLVQGVDVWLNTPEYPLEASGTSGQKAGINGVLNLSVLDGWWPEGYAGDNGWAITPHPTLPPAERDDLEARSLLEILEEQIVPLYYERSEQGHPPGWVQRAKRSMQTLIPAFNSERMVLDYCRKFYGPASTRGRELAARDHAAARELTTWKQRVAAAWPQVSLQLLDAPPGRVEVGTAASMQVGVHLAGLSEDDVIVECVLAEGSESPRHLRLLPDGHDQQGRVIYRLSLEPHDAGEFEYRVRAYPYHALLTHRFETGLMTWL